MGASEQSTITVVTILRKWMKGKTGEWGDSQCVGGAVVERGRRGRSAGKFWEYMISKCGKQNQGVAGNFCEINFDLNFRGKSCVVSGDAVDVG